MMDDDAVSITGLATLTPGRPLDLTVHKGTAFKHSVTSKRVAASVPVGSCVRKTSGCFLMA